jgi:hypothetical protein
MNETPLHSSVLAAFRYDPDREHLWIRFRSGDLYVYQKVLPAIVQSLLAASSHGHYFNTEIRDRFPYIRLS